MKYIITENQSRMIHVLRRINEDYDLIWDIVDEGVDIGLCSFDTFQEYYNYVCLSSAKTYLYNYFENEKQEGYSKMEEYIIDLIKKDFRNRITEFWDDNKEDC